MNCCYCGAPLGAEDSCLSCNADVRIWKKTNAISNHLYNKGLEKAKARELSSAAKLLQTSLRYNKLNTTARNLLGLVYFEQGETVEALSEWVISSSFAPEDAASARFLAETQNSAAMLDGLNQAIKKFNQALTYCREGNHDLAVIQLKKVLSLNPNMLKGYHLLALLYMREGRHDLALQTLQEAGKIDAKNDTTMRYAKECRGHLRASGKTKASKTEETITYQSGNETIIRPKKIGDNSAFRTVISLLMGAAIGVAAVWFLVVPEVQQQANSTANSQLVEANQTIASKDQTIENLEAQLAELEEQLNGDESGTASVTEQLEAYKQLLSAYAAYNDGDYTEATTLLDGLAYDTLDEADQTIYSSILEAIQTAELKSVVQEGKTLYSSYDYSGAIEKFLEVAEDYPTYNNGELAYYLASAYYHKEEYSNALKWYLIAVENLNDGEMLQTAQSMVSKIEGWGYKVPTEIENE